MVTPAAPSPQGNAVSIRVHKYNIIDSRVAVGSGPRFRDMLLSQKFTEPIETVIQAPANADFFSFGVQVPKATVFMLVVWATVDTMAATVPRKFILALTGHKLDRWTGEGRLVFIGSVRIDAEEGSWRGPDAHCHQFHLFEQQGA